MKKKFFHFILLFVSVSLVLSACKKDDDPAPTPVATSPTAGLSLLSESYAIGAGTKVEVWAKTSYYTGYNQLYLFLKDSVSGAVVKNAAIQLHPMMDMGTMMHSAPYENPASALSSDGLYPCAVVFLMSSMGGTWTLDATINNNENGLAGMASFNVSVVDLPKSRIKSFISSTSSETLFVSLIKPADPVVGINDLEVVIHKRINMGMEFPADSGLTVEISPLMVSMGHGSPNNVNPVHMGMGHYRGAVNYTMSGDWQINFTFKDAGNIANSATFFETIVP